jgi:hypothetical protein
LATSIVQAQLPEVEAVLGRCVLDFHDRTSLQYVLIFPIMHKMAVKLFVEDFGVESALKHYEHIVASLTSDGTIRESQFESFRWPDVRPQDIPHKGTRRSAVEAHTRLDCARHSQGNDCKRAC